MRWTREQLAEYQAARGAAGAALAAKPNKYKAVPVVIDGYRFPSNLEGQRYTELKILQAAGEITHFLRQVPFHLPGGLIYRLDFLVFWADGRIGYEDSKGCITPTFAIKKKLVEAKFPVEIELVKRK